MTMLNRKEIKLTENSFKNINDTEEYVSEFFSLIFNTSYFFNARYILNPNIIQSVAEKYKNEYVEYNWTHNLFDNISDEHIVEGHIKFLSNFNTFHMEKTQQRVFHVYIHGFYKKTELGKREIFKPFFTTTDYDVAVNIIKDLTTAFIKPDMKEINIIRKFVEDSTIPYSVVEQNLLNYLNKNI